MTLKDFRRRKNGILSCVFVWQRSSKNIIKKGAEPKSEYLLFGSISKWGMDLHLGKFFLNSKITNIRRNIRRDYVDASLSAASSIFIFIFFTLGWFWQHCENPTCEGVKQTSGDQR